MNGEKGLVGEPTQIRIGPWTVTPALNQLERDGRCIKVEPRAMDVLVVLARSNGAVVSVEELIASVWKGVVVGDGSVYLAIRQLRAALDDPASGVRYIETIPKRGYRLVGLTGAEPESAPAQRTAASSRWRGPVPGLWLGAALVGIALAAALVLAPRATPPPHAISVAVLPFKNLSSDPEQEYFADGVTVEILSALSNIEDLQVTGQLSSFHFKDREASLGAVGATLGVKHVLEGSVRKAGEQMRITAQLSDARTGQQLWAESYNRELGDIFLVQDEIAKAVASALEVKLGLGDLGRVPGMTRNVAAYDEYLRGKMLFDGSEESVPLRLAHMQRAVALDPSFSIAWSALSSLYANGAVLVPSRAGEWRQQSDAALARARELTPDSPHVLLATAVAESRHGRWVEAAKVFERMEASYSRYRWHPRGSFFTVVGRLREAIPVLERARAQEPLDAEIAALLALAYTVDGHVAAALAEVDRGLALDTPDTPLLRIGVLIALGTQNRAEIEKRMRALPGIPPQVERLVANPAGAGAELRQLARTAGPLEKYAIAFWAAYFDEPDLSLELWSEGTRDIVGLWLPIMRDVRRLPAFKDVVRELGLVDYWRAYGWSDFCRPISVEDFACG